MSFVCWDLNVGKWEIYSRMILGLLFFIYTCFTPLIAISITTIKMLDDE